jgi:hypothetical protein
MRTKTKKNAARSSGMTSRDQNLCDDLFDNHGDFESSNDSLAAPLPEADKGFCNEILGPEVDTASVLSSSTTHASNQLDCSVMETQVEFSALPVQRLLLDHIASLPLPKQYSLELPTSKAFRRHPQNRVKQSGAATKSIKLSFTRALQKSLGRVYKEVAVATIRELSTDGEFDVAKLEAMYAETLQNTENET